MSLVFIESFEKRDIMMIVDRNIRWITTVDLDFDLLRTFLAVIEHRGFTRAASRLNKTQSTISLHIKRLEETVGTELFERDGHRIRLTDHGEILQSYAEAIIETNNQALLRLRKPQFAGTIRLGLPEDFATRHLPSALHRVLRSFPNVRLEVRSALTAELMRDYGNGDLDLVLARREFGASDGIVLWKEPLMWVVSASASFERDPLPLVMFPPGCVYRPEVLRRMRSFGRPWEITYTSTSLAGVQAAVSAGFGISVLARSTVLPEFKILDNTLGLPDLPDTEIALYTRNDPNEATSFVAEYLRESVERLNTASATTMIS
jgi:DNA-binding transcriptional LysR family regulator